MARISEIEIVPISPRDGLVGFASFTLHDEIRCNSVAIMSRPSGGYRLVFPTKKVSGKYMGVFYPINHLAGSAIENAVIKKYEDVTKDLYARYDSSND